MSAADDQAREQELQDQLRTQITIINDAIARANAHEIKNMNNVDAEVARICANLQTGNIDVSDELQGLMAEMINRLDELARVLEAFQDWAARQDGGSTEA